MLYNEEAKLDIYNKMSYVDYFNVKARGYTRELQNLKNCDEFCTLTPTESSKLKNRLLEQSNKFPDKKNVLYVHIPFCVTHCEFCPYYVSAYSRNKVEEYLDAFEQEILHLKDLPYVQSTTFDCLYFGGGTPSILSVSEIKRVVSLMFQYFRFKEDGEFTYESNAATLTQEKILALKECGINRISLGIQTFNDRLLKEMNCAHNSEKAKEVINIALENGMVVNIDLIFGLIHQSQEEIIADINELKEFNQLDQVTYFPLRIMANTSLEKLLYQEEAMDIKEHFNHLLDLDQIVEKTLHKNGYVRELDPIFYHSTKSYEHKYLSTGTRVLGLGAGAGSLIDYGEFSNHDSVDEYIKSIKNNEHGVKAGAPITSEQAYERYILFCIIYLNRSIGNMKEIITNQFVDYFNTSIDNRYEKVVQDMIQMKFAVVDEDGKIKFTNRMWHVLGQVKIGMPSII